MPTYEYLCEACDHQFEEFQSMSADALTKCPECKKKKLVRVFGGGAAIIFKGSGFYETDYRSQSYKDGAKKEQESSKSATESSGDTAGKDNKTDSGKSSTGKKNQET